MVAKSSLLILKVFDLTAVSTHKVHRSCTDLQSFQVLPIYIHQNLNPRSSVPAQPSQQKGNSAYLQRPAACFHPAFLKMDILPPFYSYFIPPKKNHIPHVGDVKKFTPSQNPFTISRLLMTMAASLVFEVKPVFCSMLPTWDFTVSTETCSASAISL